MELSIGELAERTGLTRRTIRYYVEIGLLPPPTGGGKAALYGEEHLERLDLIKKLQSMRLSLEEIREQLSGRRSDMVLRAMALPESPKLMGSAEPMPSTAAEYIASLRELRPAYEQRSISDAADRLAAYDAEPWVRVSLTPDVELHVRRRGARSPRWLWRLVKEARKILEEEKEEM